MCITIEMFDFLIKPSYTMEKFSKCLSVVKITQELVDQMKKTGSREMSQDLSFEDQGCWRETFVDIFKSVEDVDAMHHKGLFRDVKGDRVHVMRREDGTFLSNLVCTGEDFN